MAPTPAERSHEVSESLAAQVRRKFGVTRKVFARLTGFSERAVASWESGGPISGPALRALRELNRFYDQLAEVVEAGVIPDWLDTPNKAFDSLKPLEVIERGEIDRLWRMLYYLQSGAAT